MKSESKEHLVARNGKRPEDDEEFGTDFYNLNQPDEYILTEIEKHFILAAEKGDCSGVKKIIDDYKEKPEEFSINCVDPLNRSALISAIENENEDLIALLLDEGIAVGDALLHAISEEYVEAVEELLQWEEINHEDGKPYSWEAVDRTKSNFTPDITPLILAAHRNNYEILKILLDRGATLPMPHDIKCGCDICITSQSSDSLRHSQSRINAYRALSSSSLIALSSRDPVLTAFELSYELKHLQTVESEFRQEYAEMRTDVQEFVTALLDHARTSAELEVMLNYNHEASTEIWMPGQRQTLERLKLAIKYKQKNFVSHPNVQQLLAAIWYDGLPGFRRKTTYQQVIQVVKLGCSFPLYSFCYLVAPHSEKGRLLKKPFVKFIMQTTSYMFFLMLLGCSSLRMVPLMFELLSFPWMLDILDDWKKHERGSLPGPIELGIIMYITSLIFHEIQSLYKEGLLEYICDLWNIVDFISNSFYVTWILMRITAWIISHRDMWYRNINPYFPREHWHPFDPMLIAEGAFAAGMILSFLKLVHVFSINPHLGPLQVSLGRMIIDIIKFFFIYTLVLFAFGCGLNQLLWYYADLEKRKCYHLHPDVPDFDDQEKACTIWRRFANLFETSQSLFWASFGLVDLISFDLAGIKGFTRYWALLLFGSYSVINIIVLLNMLIAMMSNSYQVIYEKADVEWKFARSQLWMSYFDDGGTLPPPFNMCPSLKMVSKMFRKRERTKSIMRRALEKAQALHESVMRRLVRRFVTAEQRKRDDYSITEDDIIEVRADISSFRFELLDLLEKNKFKLPDIERKKYHGATKKGRVLERRIKKDFQIGIVETIATQMQKDNTKDVFGTIAKVISRGGINKSGETDWNALVRQNTIHSNPIGSTKSSMIRRSQRSLRRKMLIEANAGLMMDTNKLVELNPRLSDVTPTTRVAYVKFMKKTLSKREELDQTEENEEENKSDEEETPANESTSSTELSIRPELVKALSLSSLKYELAKQSSLKKPDNSAKSDSQENVAKESSNATDKLEDLKKRKQNMIKALKRASSIDKILQASEGESPPPEKGKAPSPPNQKKNIAPPIPTKFADENKSAQKSKPDGHSVSEQATDAKSEPSTSTEKTKESKPDDKSEPSKSSGKPEAPQPNDKPKPPKPNDKPGPPKPDTKTDPPQKPENLVDKTHTDDQAKIKALTSDKPEESEKVGDKKPDSKPEDKTKKSSEGQKETTSIGSEPATEKSDTKSASIPTTSTSEASSTAVVTTSTATTASETAASTTTVATTATITTSTSTASTTNTAVKAPAATTTAKPTDTASQKQKSDQKEQRENLGTSTSAAGASGDRGKSTVTGKMISGWL